MCPQVMTVTGNCRSVFLLQWQVALPFFHHRMLNVSQFLSILVCCVIVHCMQKSQEWLHISQEVNTIQNIPEIVFSCAYILAGWQGFCTYCDRSFRLQTSSASSLFIGLMNSTGQQPVSHISFKAVIICKTTHHLLWNFHFFRHFHWPNSLVRMQLCASWILWPVY